MAVSHDRKRRLLVFRRRDGLYVLHDQRLIDLDAVPDDEHDVVKVPFPPEGDELPPHCQLLDMPMDGALYGNEADAAREAVWLVRV